MKITFSSSKALKSLYPHLRHYQLLKSLQLHHPVNGGDVGAESGAPGLKAENPADAYPISHQVQGLHDLLWCRSSLMGCVHVNLDMRDQVSARDARYDDKQFFGFAVYKPLLEVGSLRVVVVPFERIFPPDFGEMRAISEGYLNSC